MSTEYTLASNGLVELYAVERSCMVEIGISRGDDTEYTETGAIYDDEELIKIIVELARVASYISDEPEQIRQRIHDAMNKDYYLGKMELR